MKRIIVVALSVILALVVAAPMALGQVGKGPEASSEAEELAAAWWQWGLSKPASINPIAGGSYSGGPQCDGEPVTDVTGKVWFLAGSFGEKVTRTCNAPADAELFFPVVNVFCSDLFTNPPDPTPYTKCAQDIMDDFEKDGKPYARVDGNDVSIQRAASDLFTLTLPNNNVVGVEAGEYQAAADGLWVKLPPLPKGQHKIEFGGKFEYDGVHPPFKFVQDNTYNLTVE